eukprot:2175711-Pyramimonas_sp.AAC.1
MDSDERGQYVELCFAADMSRVVLSEQQRRMLDFDIVTNMRVYLAAAAKRAVVVKEDDLLAKADVQTNPVKDFEIRIQIELREEREGRDGTCHQTTRGTSGFHGPGSRRRGNFLRNGAAVESETTR